MLDKLKAMQALGSLMKNKEQLAEAGERIKSKMDAMRVDGQAGGGACRAVVNGKMKLIDLTLDPALLSGMAVDEKTRDLATTLIKDAINDATENAQKQVQQIIAKEADDLGLGDMAPQLTGLLS
ncbi:MAG: YbaB/EbfC family nucleoid-associated protein [Phycisphaerales bacterium]|nr:YbaB/EbfC family nucleoid-associated protein [Phycisphaerales bacterium]|tara:strand:+ start:127204 stop:127575 length:372 start_codon:yes stop_codon:yes gene_type:complete